ncbi:glycosyltransferase family 2 protein [Aquibium carbonis]|uniref:glycosyltransferase family 2 protein n=1 Tax=Aquibium carbonis TaxID=2495581 RepID=UPI00147982FA|nr:glycosyltransferase family 2 protein [Aquibium carbonis]
MAVTIVVLSYNRRDALESNLAGLLRMVDENGCELVIVDNASTDGSVEMIRAAATGRTGVTALLNDRNLGVAGGRNAGWRAAGRDFILTIDDDTFVTTEAVGEMLSIMHRRPDMGIITPIILDARTKNKLYDYGEVEFRIGNFQGGCHMLRRSLLETVGYNDEACTFGGEELDLSIRVRAAGSDVVYTPRATVLHDGRVRYGKEGSDRRARWLYNFVRVHHKHFPLAAALPLSLRYLLSHLVAGLRANGLRAVPVLLGSGWRGLRDGRRQHVPVPPQVVRFYTNPTLRPDLGNVPLLHKLRRRVVR